MFNSLGYNGLLFKQIFDDFYNLVREINTSGKTKSGDKLVNLYYLEETRDEVNYFFQTAENILKGTTHLDTSKTAMKTIVEGFITSRTQLGSYCKKTTFTRYLYQL